MHHSTQKLDQTGFNVASEMMLPMWAEAGLEPVANCSTATAVKVLRAGGGFDCTRDLLQTWAANGTLKGVLQGPQGLQWSNDNLIQAAGLLNASRRWLLTSGHVAKMSAVELEEARARQRGETIFDGLDDMDCRSLLGVIANPKTDDDTRSALCQAIISKLQRAGIE